VHPLAHRCAGCTRCPLDAFVCRCSCGPIPDRVLPSPVGTSRVSQRRNQRRKSLLRLPPRMLAPGLRAHRSLRGRRAHPPSALGSPMAAQKACVWHAACTVSRRTPRPSPPHRSAPSPTSERRGRSGGSPNGVEERATPGEPKRSGSPSEPRPWRAEVSVRWGCPLIAPERPTPKDAPVNLDKKAHSRTLSQDSPHRTKPASDAAPRCPRHPPATGDPFARNVP
jgi:hypothetical protein